MSIESLECSGQLRTAMLQHADAMTELYRTLNKMIHDGTNDDETYAPLFEKAGTYSTWFKSRKKVANSMKAAATTSTA